MHFALIWTLKYNAGLLLMLIMDIQAIYLWSFIDLGNTCFQCRKNQHPLSGAPKSILNQFEHNLFKGSCKECTWEVSVTYSIWFYMYQKPEPSFCDRECILHLFEHFRICCSIISGLQKMYLLSFIDILKCATKQRANIFILEMWIKFLLAPGVEWGLFETPLFKLCHVVILKSLGQESELKKKAFSF